MGDDSFLTMSGPTLALENIIRNNKQLYKEYNTGKTIHHFKPEDTIKCSYIKGLYRIVDVYDNKVLAYSVSDKTTELFSPDFLIKVKANKKVMDLLYEKKP